MDWHFGLQTTGFNQQYKMTHFREADDDETSLVLSLTEGGSPATNTQPSPTLETKGIFDSPDGNSQGTPWRHGHLCVVVGSNSGILAGPQSANRDRFQGVETLSTPWSTPLTHPNPYHDHQDDFPTYPTLWKSENGPLRKLTFDALPVTRRLQPSPVGAACVSHQVSPFGNFESLLHAVEVMIEDEPLLASDSTRLKQAVAASSPLNGPPLQSGTGPKKRRSMPVSIDSMVTKRPRQHLERVLPVKSLTTRRSRGNSRFRRPVKPSLAQGSRYRQSTALQSKNTQSALQKISIRSPSKREVTLKSAELRTPSPPTPEASAAVGLISTFLAHHPTQARKLWVHLVLRNYKSANVEWRRGALPTGFVWSDFPPLERVLQEHAPRYYEISYGHNQSRLQAAFYRTLMDRVRAAARDSGCDLEHIADPQLRNRIRFYYKTHLQNAKKRLRTLLHPNNTKAATQQHLTALLPVLRDLEHETQGSSNSYGHPSPLSAHPFGADGCVEPDESLADEEYQPSTSSLPFSSRSRER